MTERTFSTADVQTDRSSIWTLEAPGSNVFMLADLDRLAFVKAA